MIRTKYLNGHAETAATGVTGTKGLTAVTVGTNVNFFTYSKTVLSLGAKFHYLLPPRRFYGLSITSTASCSSTVDMENDYYGLGFVGPLGFGRLSYTPPCRIF